ncbi:MAG: A24 family peptidase [Pirellulales bacterium]|nr:A24 family peptidase [Pirellulales bacterium]
MTLELVLAAVWGLLLGAVVNVAVARLAWTRVGASPWWTAPASLPRRSFWTRVPVLGWFVLRGEASHWGTAFWVRPLLLELGTAAGVAGLYWLEVVDRALLPATVKLVPPPNLATIVHVQFLAHSLLLALMLAAAVIDLDELIIPDSITIPGTLAGLAMGATWPWMHLPILDEAGEFTWLAIAAPQPWPAALDAPGGQTLALGLACVWIWCLGLLPRPWRLRRGWGVALRLLYARMLRSALTPWILALGGVVSAAVVGGWAIGGETWRGLLTSLVGLFGGGLIVWVVRVVGTAALGREAMGFGDVTLLGMIGAFLGWQTCVLVFFLAPFMGILLGVLQYVARRETVMPYGPFLCLAAAGAIAGWRGLWEWAESIFALGWIVPAALTACMGTMGGLLLLYRALSEWAVRKRP